MKKQTRKCLERAMKACPQTDTQTVYEHGVAVSLKYKELLQYLRTGSPISGWRLPEWINHPSILPNLFPDHIMETYHIYHDCGKPYCIEYDAEGKRHFPNHAVVSYERWTSCVPNTTENNQIGNLILMDMDVHMLKNASASHFAVRDEAISLLITALCEIHANAEMFGGIESTSFKIKWKHLNKVGKSILREMVGVSS